MNKATKVLKGIVRWMVYSLLAIFLLFALIVLLVRMPSIQNWVTTRITTEVSKRTGAELKISHLYLTFSGGVEVEKLYLADPEGDTILYTNYLSTGIAIAPLLYGNYQVSHIELADLSLNLLRGQDSLFNFSFLIDSLAGKSETSSVKATPEEKKEMPVLSSGPIHLSNIRFNYTDSLIGIDLKTRVNELRLLPRLIDLAKMQFGIVSIELDGSKTSYIQFETDYSSSDTSSSALPLLSWDLIHISETEFGYRSMPSGDEMMLSLSELNLGSSVLNLTDSVIKAGQISASKLDFLYATSGSESTTKGDSTVPFTLPAWKIELAGLEINKSKLAYRVGESTFSPTFSPSQIIAEHLELKLGPSKYHQESSAIELRELSLLLNSSFQLDMLRLNTRINPDNISLKNFLVKTPSTELSSDLDMEFTSLSEFIADPMAFSRVSLSIPPSTIGLRDLLFFQPELDTIEIFSEIAAYPVHISGNLDGKVDDLVMEKFHLALLESTELTATGAIKGLPDTSSLSFSLSSLELHTGVKDLAWLMDTGSLTLPTHADLNGNFSGDMNNLQSQFKLTSDMGNVEADLDIRSFSLKPSYEIKLDLIEADLNRLAGIPELEPVTASFDLKGGGLEPSEMNAKLNTSFTDLTYRGYNYRRLELSAGINDGELDTRLAHQSQELAMNALITGRLDSSLSKLKLDLQLAGGQLKKLGLSENDYKVGFELKSDVESQGESLALETTLKKGLLISGADSYRLDSLYLFLLNRPDTAQVMLHSDFLRSQLTANCNLEDLLSNLRYYSGYQSDTLNFNPEDYEDFSMSAIVDIIPDPLLAEVVIPQLQDFDTIHFAADFTPRSEEITASLHTSGLTYGSRSIQNLALDLSSSHESGLLNLSFEDINGPYLNIGSTSLILNRKGTAGSGSLTIMDQAGILDYHLSMIFDRAGESNTLKISNDSLILNQQEWQIDPQNSLNWGTKGVLAKNFRMFHDQEELQLATSPSLDELEISFQDFDLNILFGLLNSERDLISGKLNGEIDLINLKQTPGFMADLKLENFQLTETELGELDLVAESTTGGKYDLDLKLGGPNIDFTAKGNYSTVPEQEVMNIDLDLKFLKLALLRDLFPKSLDSTQGQISAHLNLDGDLRNPDYDGEIRFENAGILAVQLGTYLRLEDEHIQLSNAGLKFNNFEIRDPANHTLILTGEIDTRNALNPSYDLSLKADNFQLINAKEGDYDLYYGQILADLDIQLSGDRELPVVRSKVTLKDETDFTYIVPASQAQVESQRGVVVFENMEDTLKILNTEENQTKTIRGYDIRSRIILKDGTQLRMLLDPRSGDNMTITGAADLDYALSPNGNMSLTGRYELNDGGYKLNLYDLVKKEFKIRRGSQILWTGSPMGASLNITAVYSTKTSAASLMDDPDPRFNRSLPFEVLLFIRGTIDQPEISFALDMPTDSRASMGGDVYSKIKQVNDDEAELNKQVFALVVFDRFIPSSESGDAGVSTADIARSSVSDFLSGQLNNLSQRYLKGVELGVNIESYTDYTGGGGQERTDLNLSLRKAFFDDRVVLEVGSNMALDGYQRSSDVVGDIAIEYLLTEEGTYRIRGYRRNDYQSPVEGEVIITGMALIFSREFSNWENLFKKPEVEEEPPEITPDKESDLNKEDTKTDGEDD